MLVIGYWLLSEAKSRFAGLIILLFLELKLTMKENSLITTISFALAVRIVKLCQYLNDTKKEYVMRILG
jgi:hypothetical protein